jgi:hypothetical protein
MSNPAHNWLGPVPAIRAEAHYGGRKVPDAIVLSPEPLPRNANTAR